MAYGARSTRVSRQGIRSLRAQLSSSHLVCERLRCFGGTAVRIDAPRFVAYHSSMSDDPNTPHDEVPDPLTVGELISLQQAADYAGLKKDSLHDYIKRGRLKAKKIGRFWVTTQAAVDEYLLSRSIENIPKKHRRLS